MGKKKCKSKMMINVPETYGIAILVILGVVYLVGVISMHVSGK